MTKVDAEVAPKPFLNVREVTAASALATLPASQPGSTRDLALLAQLRANPFVLAPMAGITDHPFRSFMKELGAGVVVTELISAKGIEYKSARTLKLMSFDNTQRPVGIQLFGEDPDTLALAALVSQDLGCDFVDLNFGCPVPKVVKSGAGSAMLKDLDQMARVFAAIKKKIEIPLTIKIRIGWDANSLNADKVAELAYNEGIAWVAIHGRTRAAGYSGQADWDYIAKVAAAAKVPIIGNGDIASAPQALSRLQTSGCAAVMIGRGCLKNPYLFADAGELLAGKPVSQKPTDLWSLYLKLAAHVAAHCDEHILQIQLKKFAAWYSSGYSDSSNFRKILFQAKSKSDILELAEAFFSNIDLRKQQDTSNEPFLMGGHG